MNTKEAIKEAEIQFDVYESMILYNKDFEPKNDNSNYERQIEFLKIAIKALEKQIPKKPVNLTCPNCGFNKIDNSWWVFPYCPKCGQCLDCSE